MTMVSDRVPVGLIAYTLDQSQHRRSLLEHNRVIIPPPHQKMADLLVATARLDDADHRQIGQAEIEQRRPGRGELPLAAIDEDQIRKRLLLAEQS